MKQFSLEEYLKNPSRKVVTRDGRKVTRFLCTDLKNEFPIVAAVESSKGAYPEELLTYRDNGAFYNDVTIDRRDLFFAPEKHEEPGVWIKIDAEHPLPLGQEVIGYNKEWVDEDFNPSGTRIGFLSGTGFFSAKWNNDQDFYSTCSEEGDDYTISQTLPDGTRKTWCKYENGEAVEGYLPNMPTHFMLIPETPDGFAWPYGTE